MFKRFLSAAIISVFFCSSVLAAGSGMVKIIAVSKATWTTETTESTKKGTSGGGAVAGAVSGWAILGGPIAIAGGALLGNHMEKSVRNKKEKKKTTSETVQGYYIKLDNGERLKTLVKYKVGQTLRRDEIVEE